MNVHEAFKHQIENTRLIEAGDLGNNKGIPLVWNGVIFRLPNGNIYSSKKPMQEGDKLLVGYVTSVHEVPRAILIEEKELDDYAKKFKVARVWDNIPVLEEIES